MLVLSFFFIKEQRQQQTSLDRSFEWANTEPASDLVMVFANLILIKVTPQWYACTNCTYV